MAFFEKRPSSRQGASQNVAIGAASAASTALSAETFQIRIAATGNCHFRVGDGAPTALATDSYLPSGVVEYITVTPGQKIAVIQDGAATGNLSVTEMA